MASAALPITLVAAGAAAILNFWLAMRVGGARRASGVSIGDGGNEALIARMRAHANFVEYTPFVLILIGLIELSQGSVFWLWLVAAIYLIGRVLHGLGMGGPMAARLIGTITTLTIMVGLGIYAVVLPFVGDRAPHVTPTVLPLPKG